jgi:putative transposase
VTRLLFKLLIWSLRALLKSSDSLVIENLALRQQLAAYARCQKRVHVQPQERAFWVALSNAWASWRSALIMVKPATVIAWHRRGFRRYWRWRSRKPGRPPIPRDHIALIRRISSDHPEWGEDRIAEELELKLGVRHSTSTIRKYMVRRCRPRRGQTWRIFIRNHAKQTFACDFLTQYTAFFAVVYIFVVMEVASRRIVLIDATDSPSLAWVKQQIRQATDWCHSPRFLVHDNDGIFGQFRDRRRRGKESHLYRCHLDLWLKETMGIQGLAIPYGAPNVNPRVERFHRTLRQEALNHFMFLNARHIRRVCREFVAYYNHARPSQALHAIPDPYAELSVPPRSTGQLVALPVLGGLIHDYRRAA